MAILNTSLIDAYASIAAQSYLETFPSVEVSGLGNFSVIDSEINGNFGFQAHAYFNATLNQLVVSFTGTEGFETGDVGELLPDAINDLQLSIWGANQQIVSALQFYAQAVSVASEAFSGFDVVLTGHSLGGFLAQGVSHFTENAHETIVFNSPGVGGILGSIPNASDLLGLNLHNYTYVYSNPSTWSPVDALIHGTGMQLSDNVLYVPNASGHSSSDLATAINPNSTLVPEGSVPLVGGSLNLYDIVSAIGDPGDFNNDGIDDLTVYQNADGSYTVIRTILNDARSNADPSIRGQDIYTYTISSTGQIIDREYAQFNPNQCFPAGTPICLWDGTFKLIESISQSDIVLTHDAEGKPVPGIVDKLFTNTTQEFVRLSFDDGREDLVSTPGHRFLTETGDYMEIGHMLRLGGGAVRLTDTDGSIVEATGEVIAYSAETAGMFEAAQQGWQAHPFGRLRIFHDMGQAA